MAPKKALLDQMKANSAGNWTIADVEKVCKQHGLRCDPPSKGSHYKVSSQYLGPILTVPQNRPIKVCYIEALTSFIDAHCMEKKKMGDEK